MKILYTTAILLVLSFSSYSQVYLLDSTYSVRYNSEGVFQHEFSNKYFYDEQERISTQIGSFGRTEYNYSDKQIIKTNFDTYNEYSGQTKRYFDDNGFEIVSENYYGTLEAPTLRSVDSTFRNDNGLILRSTDYNIDQMQMTKSSEALYQYFPNDDRKLIDFTSYISGEIYLKSNTEYFQNDQEVITLGVRVNTDFNNSNSVFVDSIFYDFQEGYRSTRTKNYRNSSFLNCVHLIWKDPDPNYAESIRNHSNNSDCTDSSPVLLTKYYLTKIN